MCIYTLCQTWFWSFNFEIVFYASLCSLLFSPVFLTLTHADQSSSHSLLNGIENLVVEVLDWVPIFVLLWVLLRTLHVWPLCPCTEKQVQLLSVHTLCVTRWRFFLSGVVPAHTPPPGVCTGFHDYKPHFCGCSVRNTIGTKRCQFPIFFTESWQSPLSGSFSYCFLAAWEKFSACFSTLISLKNFWGLCDELCCQCVEHHSLLKDCGLHLLPSVPFWWSFFFFFLTTIK